MKRRKDRIYMTVDEQRVAADRWREEQWPRNNFLIAGIALAILIALIGVGMYFGVVTND